MISRSAVHALKAVMMLAEKPDGGFKGTAEIAQRIGAPPNYLGKLLQTLARAGVLRSQKGLGGGFQLARPPKRITLLEVVEPIDHMSRLSGCIMGQTTCSADKPCPLHDRWSKVRQANLDMLDGCSVAETLPAQRAPRRAR